MILVTGGSGFIGSNFILNWFKNNDEAIINLDKLTYAGNQTNLKSLDGNEKYIFMHGDIADMVFVKSILLKFNPRAIINFAAESHVDRSIEDPHSFINTNVVGTHSLLDCTLEYYKNLNDIQKSEFRFLHISTDEVYGSLDINDKPFTEENQYKPNSPYSASKAASDHIVRAYFHTYNLPVITTNCSNNYGAYQYPEKLIPLCIDQALTLKEIPIYGDGSQIRDWLYVDDHCSAIEEVLLNGKLGEVYNIGGWNEQTNLSVVELICKTLDMLAPKDDKTSYKNQIKFVSDRPGHDKRYAINSNKIYSELGWKPIETFKSGLIKTINWYLSNNLWISEIKSKQSHKK